LAWLPFAAPVLAGVPLPAAAVLVAGLCVALAVTGRLVETDRDATVLAAGFAAGFAAGAGFAATAAAGFLDCVCAGAAAAYAITAMTAHEALLISGALILTGIRGPQGCPEDRADLALLLGRQESGEIVIGPGGGIGRFAAQDAELHRVTGLQRGLHLFHILDVVDMLPGDGDDYVALL